MGNCSSPAARQNFSWMHRHSFSPLQQMMPGMLSKLHELYVQMVALNINCVDNSSACERLSHGIASVDRGTASRA